MDATGHRRLRATWALAALASAATALVALVVAAPPPASAHQGDQVPLSAAEELAERHAPVMMLKSQDGECDPDGEPYGPISVEAVLANPQVLLRQVGTNDPVMMQGPTAADLFDLGDGFYLDFPGDALAPGCTYEKDNRRFTRDLPPTVYAQVIEGAGDGKLVLQYWSFWYYNDWNNKHEGDWEGIGLLFDVPTAAQALGTDPVLVGYAQHEGGERAGWDADKLEREGDRPVVYSSAGSHASYFGPALYLGRSGSEGFGCDNTDGPHDRVDPEVVVVPSRVDQRDDPLAWLAFEGRWGERQAGAFNGPTGPAMKDRWSDPLRWFDDLRSSSVVVPGGDRSGDGVVRAFCGAVEAGSALLVSFTSSPTTTLLFLAAITGIIVFLVNRTRWDRVAPLPVRSRRRFGQIVRASIALYRRHPVEFAVVGFVYIPLLVVAGIVATVLHHVPVLGPLLEVSGTSSGTGVALAVFAGSLPNVVAYVVVNAVVVELAARAEAGEQPDVVAAFGRVWSRRRALAAGFGRALVTVVVLLASVVGIPWGLRQLVRYQFLAQAVMADDLTGAGALRRSSELTRGRWWHTAVAVGLLQVLLLGGGLVLGLILLLVVSSLPLWVFSVLVGLLSAALVPLGAIGVTLLYGDTVAEAEGRRDAATGTDSGAPGSILAR